MENIIVTANGVSGRLLSIDYKNRTATIEMDYRYLVTYPWSMLVVKEA